MFVFVLRPTNGRTRGPASCSNTTKFNATMIKVEKFLKHLFIKYNTR